MSDNLRLRLALGERVDEGEDIVDWAVRTGRIEAATAEHWRGLLDDESDRIEASGGGVNMGLTMVEKVLRDARPAGAPVHASAELQPGEDIAEWGYRTGRYPASRIPFWRDQLAGERRQVMASGTDPGGSEIAEVIRSLAPVLAEVRASASRSATPHLDALDRALFGPTREQREREEDLAAERELATIDERQRVLASTGLTNEEYVDLFGPDS